MNTPYQQLLAQKNSIILAIINKKFVLECHDTHKIQKIATGGAIADLRDKLNQLEKELLKTA